MAVELERLVRVTKNGARYRSQHPALAQSFDDQAASGTAVAVLDAPLLLESGWDTICERLMFVAAPRQTRLERVLARGWSKEDFVAREAAQESLDSKRKRADVEIDNSGSPEQTRAQVEHFWQSLFD